MESSATPSRRSYDQYEPTARALDILGQRWSLLVVRELLRGPQRFTDLREGLPGIGPNVLAERLAHLQESGVVRRATLPPPAASSVYELTELGEELRSVVTELGKWGTHFLGAPTSSDRFRLRWLMRALEAMFRSEKAAGVHESYEFRLEGEVFHAQVDDGKVEFREGHAADPAWIVTTDVATFVGLGGGVVDPAEAVATGKAEFWGEWEAGMRSVELLGSHLGSLQGPGGMLGAIREQVQPGAAAGLTERYEFRSGDEVFHVDVAEGEVHVRPGRAEDPAFVFTAELDIMFAMYLGRLSAAEAIADAGARLDGDREAAARAWPILDIRPGS